ncbi:MAG TPA: MFS transporter, partial [Acidimicrobiales bacterium]
VVSTTTHSWTSTTTVSWLIAGAALLIGFMFWEGKVASHPLMPFRIFKSRPLSTANVIMFLVGGAFFSMWYFLTYYFQFVLKYGPVKAGFAFLPMAIGIIAGAQISSRLIARAGARSLLQVGASLATLGFLWISLIQSQSSYWGNIFVPGFVCAFAMGLLFSPLAMSATSGVDRADAGLASGVLNTSRQVGGSLALAILATVATDRTHSLLHTVSTASALVSGYQRAFQISAAVTFVALLATFALPRLTGRASAPAPAEAN